MWTFSDVITVIFLTFNFLFKIACAITFVWTIISLVDISIHNLTTCYEYSNWNIFEMFFNINK